MIRYLLSIPILLCVLCQNLSAQFRFDVWAIDDGLPQNSVRTIVQTRDGYLWLATLDGLVRFDGVRFTVFNKSTHKDLVTTRFTTLFEAGDGALWLGTESNGVVRFFENKFENYTTKDGLPADQVIEIYAESDRRTTIGTPQGIAYWQDGKIYASADNLNNSSVWMFEFPNRIRRGGEVVNLPFSLLAPPEGRPFEDRSGAVWIPQDFGLWRFQNGNFERFDKKQNFLGEASCFWEDTEGTLWIGTAQQGIYQFREGIFTHLTTENGLPSNEISTIFQDREGTIWLGMSNRGLVRVQKQLISSFSSKEGLKGVNAYPVLADSRRRVWVGKQGDALDLIENGAVRQIPLNGIRSLTEAPDGTIWIAGQDWIYLYRNDKLEKFQGEIAQELISNFVHAIQFDRAGNLWVSTTVGVFRLQNGEWTHFNKADGFPTNETRFVHETASRDFYVGTYDGLISIADCGLRIADCRIKTLTTADGLSSNHLRCIYEEADGTLWIGTYDGGLSRFKDGNFVGFSTADGLFSDGVFAILEDEAGNFWMSSNQGIHRVAKKELNDFADGRIKKLNGIGYGKRDGMLNAECNGGRQPTAAKTTDGRLWFPTQDGVAIVNPKLLPYNNLPPPVVIENALVDREKIGFRDEIRLEPNQSNLEIQFTALSFIRSEQMRFRYKLEGLNDDWVDAGTRRDAYFSYLPPGDYVFRVTAANADGVWNEQGASVRVRVIPPFYRTWWFVALTALVIMLLVFTVFRYRFNQLQREKMLAQDFSRRLIESQEQERGRIAAELHDGLSQSLVIIKNRAALSLNKKGDTEHAFEQLEEIAQASTEAIDEAKEIIYNLRPIQLDRLGLTKAILAMFRRVSETHGIEFQTDIEPLDDIFSKEAESSIYRILQESVNNIVRHSAASQVVVKIKRNLESVEILIQDDGKGFVVESNNGTDRSGFGLTGIKERARLLGGEALIESEIGKGTSVKINLSIKNDDDFNS